MVTTNSAHSLFVQLSVVNESLKPGSVGHRDQFLPFFGEMGFSGMKMNYLEMPEMYKWMIESHTSRSSVLKPVMDVTSHIPLYSTLSHM